ncbi:MAG: histidinol-phosphate transaminase [Gammaproteobacteria bacterium]
MSSSTRIERWITPAVRALSAYHVPLATGMVKLDAMENPYSWPSNIVDEWVNELRRAAINRYPDPESRALKNALRDFLDVDQSVPMLLGNGSDELIQMMAMAMAAPGRTVMAPEPTFVMYRLIAEVLGYRFIGVPLREGDFQIDAEAMLQAIAMHQPAIVFLAWPNNPTGNLFDRGTVEAIIAAAPGLVVIDEAYYPFARDTWLHEFQRYDNVVIMQTLSKAGLAGLRVGMLFGSSAWLDEFNKVRLPYNINILSQVSAAFITRHADLLHAQTRKIAVDRETLYQTMKTLRGVKVWPSQANFLLFRVANDARAVFDSLKSRGILIKCLHGAHRALENCLRVTVGNEGENTLFLDALNASLT